MNEEKQKNRIVTEEDDGRTVASMEGLDSRGIGALWFGALDPNVRAEHGFGRSGRREKTGGKEKDERKPYDRSPVSYRAGAAPFDATAGAAPFEAADGAAPYEAAGGAAPFDGTGGTTGQPGQQSAGYAEPMDPEDRRALIKYVIGYSLAIGAVFAVVFGIVIFLMWKFW